MRLPNLGDNDQIVRAISERSNEGYEWLLKEVAPRVKGLLVQKFGSGQEEDLETAIVEAAEALWMQGEPYDPAKGSLVTWLYAPSMRNCVSLFRARATRPLFSFLPNSKLAEEFAEESNDGRRSARMADLVQRLTESVDRLSPGEQQVIRATLQGYSGPDAELGTQLGTSDNAVRVLRSRALKKLGKFLADAANADQESGEER